MLNNQEETGINGIQSTLQEMNSKLSEILYRIDGIETKIKEHDEKFKAIEEKFEYMVQVKQQQDSILAENRIIKDKLKQVSDELNNELRKKNRKKLEIIGIPRSNNENIEQVIIEASNKSGYPISKDNIKEIFRKRDSNKGAGAIIVKLQNQETRDKLLAAIKKVKLNTAIMGFSGKQTNIYANAMLLPETKQIFYQVKIAKEKKNWSSCWIYASDVYIKQEAQSKPIKISTLEELVTILQ